MSSAIDRLILGSNPLYGVDHYSAERARTRLASIDAAQVSAIMKCAFEAGAQGFNFSPHPLIYDAFRILKAEGFAGEFGLYPMIPDTRRYITAQLTKGSLGALKETLSQLSPGTGAKAVLQGGLSLLALNPYKLMNLYLEVEVKAILRVVPRRAVLRTVLAHEVMTDMILALNASEWMTKYCQSVRTRFKVKPGFVTRNFPRFVQFCEECDISLSDIVIMTPVNPIGFQMTPDRVTCEETFARISGANVIAMSILAAGQVDLQRAVDYVAKLPNLDSVAVGVSTTSHAKETFAILTRELLR